MDQLPRLGKRELICLLLFTCNYVVSVWRGFLFLWVLWMGYVILLWHSLGLPYNYFKFRNFNRFSNLLVLFCLRSTSRSTIMPPPPQPKGGGTYCFWCGYRRRPRCFVSARYLLNRWTDFDQTCTDTLLGGRNELIRFW